MGLVTGYRTVSCGKYFQDLDTGLATGYRTVSRGKTWRSNDGLITPVSFDGCSPYHTPGDSPAESPLHVAKFHPSFFTRVPLTRVSTGGTCVRGGRRRGGLQGSDSVASLNNPSPHRGQFIHFIADGG